ncbi:HD domain-containing protein [Rhodohalobacter sp. SW132]|uniref:CCA tRNA nucleotidyltransferase n=1 Tax=Rhodohalobacter sp. SW132 TaxID=2293433 RepID=UPI000E285D87|nr:HD domain-containing protein [Rhodohalobacter sp. SW132]REL38783.1 HD domain-containing protein [Rhodohalobacter sp. SW132]
MDKNTQIDIPQQHTTLFKTIGKAADELDQSAYVVGGYVRDVYLGRLDTDDTTDIDFVTIGSGIQLAKSVAKKLGSKDVTVFKKFGTAQVKHNGLDLEFVGARKESYRRDSRKPIVENGTLKDDQLRRDLTINALSWSLNEETFGLLQDPFHGVQDLKNKIIRTPIDPEKTFEDDPLRMMRAVRFAAQLKFTIEDETFSAIQKMAHRLSIISKERIIEELNKIVLTHKPSYGFELLLKSGLLEQFFPEMVKLQGVDVKNGQRHKDNFWHTLKVLDNVAAVSDNLWLRWAAIMHDIAKPPTKRFSKSAGWTFHGHDALGAKWTPKIFRRLGLPLDDRMKYVQKLVRLHLRPIALVSDEVSDSAVRRLIYEAGDDIEDLMTLCRADITSKNEWRVQKYRNNFDRVEKKIKTVEKKDKIRNWTNPISGEDIMEVFDVKPGPIVGKVKDKIKNAIFDGEIPNDRDEAYQYLLKLKEDVGEKE